MIVKTLEVIEYEYRWMKRFARILLLSLMAFPVFQYGPLLWKDASYEGRWLYAAAMEPQPIECSGYPSLIQLCELRFAERTEKKVMKLNYMVFGVNWTNVLPDIIRSSSGHYSGSVHFRIVHRKNRFDDHMALNGCPTPGRRPASCAFEGDRYFIAGPARPFITPSVRIFPIYFMHLRDLRQGGQACFIAQMLDLVSRGASREVKMCRPGLIGPRQVIRDIGPMEHISSA